jgi:hypothetical protein
VAEARTLGVDAIRALAESPRDTSAEPELAPVADDEWTPVPALVDIWQEAAQATSGTTGDAGPTRTRREPTDDERRRHAVAAIRASWPHPQAAEAPEQHVSRHAEYLMPLAGYFAGILEADAVRELLTDAAEASEDRSFLDGRDWRSEIERLAADAAHRRERDLPVRGLPTLAARFPVLADVLGTIWPSARLNLGGIGRAGFTAQRPGLVYLSDVQPERVE